MVRCLPAELRACKAERATCLQVKMRSDELDKLGRKPRLSHDSDGVSKERRKEVRNRNRC